LEEKGFWGRAEWAMQLAFGADEWRSKAKKRGLPTFESTKSSLHEGPEEKSDTKKSFRRLPPKDPLPSDAATFAEKIVQGIAAEYPKAPGVDWFPATWIITANAKPPKRVIDYAAQLVSPSKKNDLHKDLKFTTHELTVLLRLVVKHQNDIPQNIHDRLIVALCMPFALAGLPDPLMIGVEPGNRMDDDRIRNMRWDLLEAVIPQALPRAEKLLRAERRRSDK
jgi:hypothetical protein